ncbi:MAG TPA: SusD/RagB family nutrient-binding outer membrane lipoprotein [Bacteroidia bacterium]|nr:SusD/RagB family nutrient-binding outer membrane lipoprotein [Bacteroidia bacterium]
MKRNIKYIGLLLSVGFLTITSCKKDFFDINESPNSPKTLKVSEVLPTAELAVGQAIGNDLKIGGGIWAQYWAQNFNASQYKAYDQYNVTNSSQRAAWLLLYSDALTDLNYIIEHATSEGKANYVAIATILKAYNFHILTDAYGDIPFSEAGKGAEGNFSPKYDSQKDVYDGIIAMLKDGISKIDLTSDVHPHDDDLIYGGDMNMWLKFANTTLLRVYTRLTNVDQGKAQAGIAEIVNNATSFPFIDSDFTPGGSETAKINYTSTGGNTNPLYASFVALNSTRNLVASATGINQFIGYTADGDLRVTALYTPAGSGYLGIPNGYLGIDNTGGFPKPPATVSYPSAITGAIPDPAAATAPVIFLSDYETYFLLAEATERGWINLGASAEELYNWGIQLSYISLGLPADETDPASDYSIYINDPNVKYALQGDKYEAIYFQKWFAMCGTQNFEAWTEGRRTGYIESNMGVGVPNSSFFTRSLNAGSNPLPARMLYPDVEVTRNKNFPGQQQLGTKLWWAK